MKQKENISLTTTISLCKEGDPRAQRQLYDMYVLKLYNIAFRILLSREDAEDAVLVTFRRAFENIMKYHAERGHIYSWLSKICVNESLTIYRKRKIQFEEIEDHLSVVSHTSILLEELEATYIYEAIQKLNEQQRIIFNLYEIEGYSHKEISAMLDMKEGTCRAYLTRAKSNLREILNSYSHINNVKERS